MVYENQECSSGGEAAPRARRGLGVNLTSLTQNTNKLNTEKYMPTYKDNYGLQYK